MKKPWKIGDRCFCLGEAQTRFLIAEVTSTSAWLVRPDGKGHGWESLTKLRRTTIVGTPTRVRA